MKENAKGPVQIFTGTLFAKVKSNFKWKGKEQ